jgi:hypothetical protein
MPHPDEARLAGLASVAGSVAGRSPSRRVLVALAVGSFLMVAPYALARATRTPPPDRTPTPGDPPS